MVSYPPKRVPSRETSATMTRERMRSPRPRCPTEKKYSRHQDCTSLQQRVMNAVYPSPKEHWLLLRNAAKLVCTRELSHDWRQAIHCLGIFVLPWRVLTLCEGKEFHLGAILLSKVAPVAAESSVLYRLVDSIGIVGNSTALPVEPCNCQETEA